MKAEKRKLVFIFLVFLFLFFVVLGKAFKIQIIDKDTLLTRAKSQILREEKIYPKRGNILDRNGHPLALNVQTYSLFTGPKDLANDYTSIRELSKIVPEISYSEATHLLKKRKTFTWLARKITLTDSQVQKIKKLKGIGIEAVPTRYYPNHELLSQVLGFVGLDNKGLSGLEYMFDKELRGEPLILRYVRDNKGRALKFESWEVGGQSPDITLSIDKDLQAIVEKYIKEAVLEHNAYKGGIGVMDALTGEILAMANYPSFDPNIHNTFREEDRKLSFITDPFEPGSVFKIFTMASALENKIAKSDTSYYCERGQLKVEGHTITEAESRKQYEWLSVKEIIQYSSNIGTTKIAFDLTFPKLKETLDKFQIGVKTGIELPGESRGIFTTDNNVSPLSLSNISFGQGVATTALQILAGYAAIANGGIYHHPTILKVEDEKKNEGTRIIAKDTAVELTDMLVAAVENGTGKNAKIPYFTIAGKTSTAQRPDKFGRYSGYVPGFIGYPVNVDKPFVIFVYVDNPDGRPYYGGQVAAPVFKKVAQHILYKSKNIIARELKNQNNVDLVKVKAAAPEVVSREVARKPRLLGENTIPDFIGLDKISAIKLAKHEKITLNHQGIGVVVSQSIASGSEIKRKDEQNIVVTLKYAPPSYD